MSKNYLKTFMEFIPSKDYKKIKDKIINQCHITNDVWGNWLSGRTEIPELAKPIINSIAGFDVFSDVIDADVFEKITGIPCEMTEPNK